MQDLYYVAKYILILSHGNAKCESGFSVNKEIIVENLHESSLVSQRMVYDSLTAIGGIENFELNQDIRRYVRSSNKKYKEALLKNKKISQPERDDILKIEAAKKDLKQLEERKRKMEEESQDINQKINKLKKLI